MRRSGQGAGAHVEHPFVVVQFAVPDVERLVVDQQPDDLAVGHVDERLALLRVAVAGLGVGQRAELEERVEVGAGQSVRLAFVEVAAKSDVSVGQCEHRFGLGQQFEVERRLADVPRFDRERAVVDHSRSSRSARSVTTTSAPCLAQRVGLAHPVDPDDQPEVPGPPGGHPGERIFVHCRLRGCDVELPSALEVGVRRWLARDVLLLQRNSVDALLNELGESGHFEHLAGIGRRRDDGHRESGTVTASR